MRLVEWLSEVIDRVLSPEQPAKNRPTDLAIFAQSQETLARVKALQDHFRDLSDLLSLFRKQTMSSFAAVITGVQKNSTLIAEAGTELIAIGDRVKKLLEGTPSESQLLEVKALLDQQASSLVAIVDTAKQTAPLTTSPVESTPTEPPVDAPVEETPVEPVSVPEMPDQVVVQPSPVDIGLDDSVAIDIDPFLG